MKIIKNINAVIFFGFLGICFFSTVVMAWGTLFGDSSAILKVLAGTFLLIMMS